MNSVFSKVLKNSTEAGVGIVEVLVGLVLISVVSIGVTMSIIMSMKTYKLAEYNLAAAYLAGTKIETLAAMNPADLDNADDSVETGLVDSDAGITCTRTTDVTRSGETIDVVVTMSCDTAAGNSTNMLDFTYQTTFVEWGG